ncbi:chaperonin 10-like protein [Cercophora scortea]|uniref:Chaperonin 10-like protein n=1 Tax=Cercophora scortea TaxID=314031 RepID=A0AAE0MCE7_9PEZI|nr:chaperonin 10-like protein [Cercophora scortea]
MSLADFPTTYRAYRRTGGPVPRTISQTTETLPSTLGPHDVLLKIRAVSLNFRDVGMLHGRYPAPYVETGIVASDAAAEVAAVGADVDGFAVGDRVSVQFDFLNLTGEEFDEGHSGLGGDVDGVLREWAVYEDKFLVHLPKHLNWEEGSTIACAGVTAWTALHAPQSFRPGTSVLLQGTGGVSMFALLIALAAGITPIISSSSDAKLAAIQKLAPPGAILGYNYKTEPDQAAAVKRLTDGKGVAIVLNNTGVGSFLADLGSLRARAGVVSVVGFLEGAKADYHPSELLAGLLGKTASIEGIILGSKLQFEELNRFLEEKQVRLQPLVDRVFEFDESKAAFDYLYSGRHVGKIVIKVQ